MSEFTVVICTRDRAPQLQRTLDALDGQTCDDFDLIVVDQSAAPDARLRDRARDRDDLEIVADDGTGLSRARNLGSERAGSPWVVFVDDDCLPEPDWACELSAAIRAQPDASLISGHVEGSSAAPRGAVQASVSTVTRERVLKGRGVRPFELGLGVCIAVRRDAIRDLGGYDVRFGPGAPEFPAADDMDFNYRFLRAGGVAFVTPRMRAAHEQWRPPKELLRLYRGYWLSAAAMAMKHVKSGDVRGGLWLWALAGRDVPGVTWSALKWRSPLRLRLAGAMLAGFLRGTVMGARRSW